MPFTDVRDAMLKNFLGIGVGDEVGAHQRLVDRHKIDSAKNRAKIVAHTLVKLFAGFKQLHTNTPWGQAFLGTVGDDTVFRLNEWQISQLVEVVHFRHDQLLEPRRNDALAFVIVHFVFVVYHFTQGSVLGVKQNHGLSSRVGWPGFRRFGCFCLALLAL